MHSRLSTEQQETLSQHIKAEALGLGFFACGIARAAHVSSRAEEHFRHWLSQGGHAGMDYMQNHTDIRLDPRLLMEGTESIVCVALNYSPARKIPEKEYQFAAYALGQDYHDIVKQKLHQLAEKAAALLPTPGHLRHRAFCDSAPVLERYWAEQAGLGWTGRNHQLIIPHAGSMFFLGELLLDIQLKYDKPLTPRCGNCRRCIEACPTGAIKSSYLDANACLSYQTIENRGALPPPCAKAMAGTIYGCDRCQAACPWNRFSTPTAEPGLQPKPELLTMKKEDWHRLTPDDYRRLFKGSAVKRAKYEGLMRNIRAVQSEPEEPKR